MPDQSSKATDLWQAVVRARAAWAQERHGPARSRSQGARSELLVALEAYVESLDELGHPVPYALRDELRLQRAVLGPNPRPAFPKL